jgi:hypothetical protein
VRPASGPGAQGGGTQGVGVRPPAKRARSLVGCRDAKGSCARDQSNIRVYPSTDLEQTGHSALGIFFLGFRWRAHPSHTYVESVVFTGVSNVFVYKPIISPKGPRAKG